MDAQLQCRLEIDRAPQQQADFRGLSRIQFVERAMITTAAIIGRIRANLGIAEFLTAQRPVNQKPQGGPLRPLPRYQFGSEDSAKAPSSASMAAFTATA